MRAVKELDMTILLVGLGSMGKRRLRLLTQHFSDVNVVGVDQNENRRNEVSEQFGIITRSSIQEALALRSYEYAFICTAPLSHASLIKLCLSEGMHVFSELNLVSDGYIDNMQLAEKKKKTLFLSSTFLYRYETRFIIEHIQNAKSRHNYTYHVGQYLPDWHPWESYKDFFVSDIRTNGCREIFAIELPWLLKAFGKVSDIYVIKGTMSGLSLQYPDNYLVTLSHESGHRGQLIIDVVTRVPVRHFEVFGEQYQIEWRGEPEKLWIADESFSEMKIVELKGCATRVEGYREFITEDAYLEEIKDFFLICEGKKSSIYGFAEDLYTIELMDRIEGIKNNI